MEYVIYHKTAFRRTCFYYGIQTHKQFSGV